MKRAFVIVLDSFGIGEAPDAYKWNDEGSNTLGAVRNAPEFNCPNLTKLGLFSIDGTYGGEYKKIAPQMNTVVARLQEKSQGKDTTTGHWEMAGIISENPMPTFPDGFPQELLDEYSRRTGRKILCNKPYSGVDVIRDYGKEQVETKGLIVYTSADSVFQVAAHEDVVPIDELYRCCEIAREMLTGEYGVGRVIARPFEGEWPYKRTSRRHDYSLLPPQDTMIDYLKAEGYETISVGKIFDIFAGKGLSESNRTVDNNDGMAKTMEMAKRDFKGLCFTNLVAFDMSFGHRNDVPGYANALTEFDRWLGDFLPVLNDDDILFITADHGCDPSTPSTDHSREYVPAIVYSPSFKKPVNLGTRDTFSDIAVSVLDAFNISHSLPCGHSLLML